MRMGPFTRRSESSLPPLEGCWCSGTGWLLSRWGWWAWKPPGSTGSPSTTCWKTTSSCGFLTPGTSRTSPVGRPTSRTLSGSASLWSTGWCAPALCLLKRSGSLGTSPATARLKNRGAHKGGPTSGEGAPRCRDKALFCSHARAWCLWKGSCADALVGGTTDPDVLAELARGRLRSKLPALRDALEGCFSSHHALMVGKILAHVDYLDESIDDLSVEIERVIAPFSEQVELLDTIPGVNRRTAETLIAEIGVDMSQFPTHRYLASWAGMCPGNEESAGKRRSGKTRKGSKWLRSALIEAAYAAARSKGTYLSAHYARLKGRRGPKKAAMAVGHSILVICYYIVQRGEPYQELGEDYFNRRRSEEAYRKRLVRQLERLGQRVVLEALPQPA